MSYGFRSCALEDCCKMLDIYVAFCWLLLTQTSIRHNGYFDPSLVIGNIAIMAIAQ